MKQVVGERPNDNVFLSPYSVSAALQMVWQGAAGETKTEMDQALALSNFKPEAAGSAYKELDQSIKGATAKVALNVANSIWYAPNIELKPQFLSINQDFYGAKLSALDFTDPRSAGVVNSWVSEATHGKINKIVEPPLSSRTGLILVNAIYFKGNWEHKFDNKATKDEPFHLRDGGQKQIGMMRQTRKFNYQEDSGFQAIRLPYVGDRLGMLIFLPATNSSPNKLLAGLNGDAWREKVMPKFQQREGTIEYNYERGGYAMDATTKVPEPVAQFAAACGTDAPTYTRDRPGLSAFAIEDGVVYHAYSTYARGGDGLWGMYQWLDRAPAGRNETRPWWRRNDEYGVR